MAIEWNRVTWYSKMCAIIIFALVFWAGFWAGSNWQKASDETDAAVMRAQQTQVMRTAVKNKKADALTPATTTPPATSTAPVRY